MSSLLLLIFSCIFPIKKNSVFAPTWSQGFEGFMWKIFTSAGFRCQSSQCIWWKKIVLCHVFFLKFMFKKMATYTARTDTPMKKATYSTLHWIIRLWQTNQMLTNQLLEFDMLVLLVLTCHKLGISLNEDSLQIGLAQIHAIINFLQNSDLKRWV